MRPVHFFALKAVVAVFGLLFQLVLIEKYGATFTGEVNRIQLWALALSMLFLPGLEFTFLRSLPMLRRTTPNDYFAFTQFQRLIQIRTTVGLLALLIVGKFMFPTPALSVIIVITLAYLFVVTRLLPLLYRIESRQFRSVFAEQGALFLIGVIVAVAGAMTAAWQLWWWTCIVGLVGNALLALAEKQPQPPPHWVNLARTREHLWANYGPSVMLVAASNFAILWLPASVASVVLGAADLATTVSMLRLIGLLLFVESVMSSYFLPRISGAMLGKERAQEISQFRLTNTVGTLGVSLFIFSGLLLFLPFGITLYDLIFFSTVVIAQLGVCLLGSPFSIAVVLSDRHDVGKMSVLMILLSFLNVVALVLLPHPETIILGFSFLQLVRAAVGLYVLSRSS